MKNFLIIINGFEFNPLDMKGLMKELDDILALYLSTSEKANWLQEDLNGWYTNIHKPELSFIINQIPFDLIIKKKDKTKYMYIYEYKIHRVSKLLLISIGFE